MKTNSSISDTMSQFAAFMVLFIFMYSVVKTDDMNFVVQYKGFNITFTEINFTDFYKCLCNPVMVHCLALTEPTAAQNTTQLSVWAIRQKYGGGSADEQPLRTCEVNQSKDLNNFTINCTRSGKSTQTLSFRVVTQSLNDSCIHGNIKLDWSSDVRTFVNTSLIQVKEEMSSLSTDTSNVDKSQEDETYIKVMTVLLSMTGICICIVVIVLVLRKKNKTCQLFPWSKSTNNETKDSDKEESDYAYIDEAFPKSVSKYNGLRHIVRNIKHPYNSASKIDGPDNMFVQDLSSQSGLTILESYSLSPKIEVLKLPLETGQRDTVVSIGSESKLYINGDVGVGGDDVRPKVKEREVNLIVADTGPDYSVVNLNE